MNEINKLEGNKKELFDFILSSGGPGPDLFRGPGLELKHLFLKTDSL